MKFVAIKYITKSQEVIINLKKYKDEEIEHSIHIWNITSNEGEINENQNEEEEIKENWKELTKEIRQKDVMKKGWKKK